MRMMTSPVMSFQRVISVVTCLELVLFANATASSGAPAFRGAALFFADLAPSWFRERLEVLPGVWRRL